MEKERIVNSDPPPSYAPAVNTQPPTYPILTQPVANQVYTQVPQTIPAQPQPWKHDLCDCFSNISLCCVAYFVPCAVYGQIQEKIGSGDCFGQGCVWGIVSCTVPFVLCCILGSQRYRVRQLNGIPEGGCGDCCTACWCMPCVLCQNARQVGLYD